MRPARRRVRPVHLLIAVALLALLALQVPAVQRALDAVLDRPRVADAATIAGQRIAAEHALQRSFAKARAQLTETRTLTLPVGKAEADAIQTKALDDLRTVRRSGLAAIAQVIHMPTAEADAYVRATDAVLESGNFDSEAGTLLAPDLYTIVLRAGDLSQQLADTATRALTQPRATPSPSRTPARP